LVDDLVGTEVKLSRGVALSKREKNAEMDELRYVKPSQPGILAIELRNMKAPENIGARRTRIRSVFVGTVGRYADANPKQI